MSRQSLSGLRVLIVEDEAMIVMLFEDMLGDLGCITVGPAYSVEQALAFVQSEPLDAAILDANLGGERTTAVADQLQAKGIPFFFATGYGAGAAAGTFDPHRVLTKPFTQDQLEAALRGLFCDEQKAS